MLTSNIYNIYIYIYIYIVIIQWLMFVQQHCFQQSLRQRMTFSLGMVLVPKNDYHSLCRTAISPLMQSEPYLGSFLCISSCLIEKVQDQSKNMEVDLVMKLHHPTSIGNTYVGYRAISNTLFWHIHIFFQLTLMCPVEIFFKKDR